MSTFLVKYSYFCKMETKILIMNIDILLLFLILFDMLFFKNNKRHLALSFNIVEDANKIDSVYFYSSNFFLFLSTVLIFLLLLFLFNIQKKNNWRKCQVVNIFHAYSRVYSGIESNCSIKNNLFFVQIFKEHRKLTKNTRVN